MALLLAASTFAFLGSCAREAQHQAEADAHHAHDAAPSQQASTDGAATEGSGAAAATEGESFQADGSYRAGEPLQATETVPLAAVLANVEQYAGQPVRIEGQIQDVCSKKGCWMVLQDGEASARVTFKDYGFFVPKNATGAHATIVAQVTRETMSEDVAKHLAAESKDGNPEAIQGPQEVVAVVASGVELQRATADAGTIAPAGNAGAAHEPSSEHSH
jgi:hypothetical protein